MQAEEIFETAMLQRENNACFNFRLKRSIKTVCHKIKLYHNECTLNFHVSNVIANILQLKKRNTSTSKVFLVYCTIM